MFLVWAVGHCIASCEKDEIVDFADSGKADAEMYPWDA